MRRLAILLGVACLLVLPAGYQATATPPTTCLGETVNDGRATDGDDFLTGSGNVDVIALGAGNDQYFAADSADVLCGNDGSDVLGGEDGADRLSGGTGADIVAGLGGADIVTGNLGTDTVKGGLGDDVVRSGDDVVIDDLFDGPGNDTIIGGPEDTWFRCADNDGDDHSGFTGNIAADPDC